MHITLLAIGRLKAGPQQDLFNDYVGRLTFRVEVKEIELKRKHPQSVIKVKESEALLAAIPEGSKVIALDERGKSLTSEAFAETLRNWRDSGSAEVCFIIGGADGLHPEVRDKADLVLQFGAMTWPHLMVRVMLAEQLFRAQAIWSGHPYHRDS
ncbi:MAG: 23S rRNA (pseudouridine(1915)-N(3))-methyltransferase RlmH [Kiloniellales bacterium]|nr:23S rRNA (pseudouridine(1915)-N(3))-methyltransferase RlmH [Kiloniellales bacterium]